MMYALNAPVHSGPVLWITGLSGSGKSTLAQALLPFFSPPAILLDGDALREVLGSAASGFDGASRKHLALIYARMAKLIADQGSTVIVATISLFHEVHAWNRANLPGYCEVFLDIPEEVLRKRDSKGLYAAHAAGQLQNMAGQEVSVEFPQDPHIWIDATLSVDQSTKKIFDYLQAQQKTNAA